MESEERRKKLETIWSRFSSSPGNANENLSGLLLDAPTLTRLSRVLPSLTAVTTLDLSNNRLCGIQIIDGVVQGNFEPSGLEALSGFLRSPGSSSGAAVNLRTLNLSGNFICGLDDFGSGQFRGEGIVALGNAIAANTSLTQLALGSNALVGENGDSAMFEAVRKFSEGIATSKSLVTLAMKAKIPVAVLRTGTGEVSLENQKLGPSEGFVIAALLARSSVNSLRLSSNNLGRFPLSPPRSAKIPSSQEQNEATKRSTPCGVECPQVIRAIADAALSRVKSLYLDANQIGESGGKALADALVAYARGAAGGQKGPERLSIGDNAFGASSSSAICAAIGGCENLVELDMTLSEQFRDSLTSDGRKAILGLIDAMPRLAKTILSSPPTFLSTVRLGEPIPVFILRPSAATSTSSSSQGRRKNSNDRNVFDASMYEYGAEAGILIAELVKSNDDIDTVVCNTHIEVHDLRSNENVYAECTSNQVGPVEAALLGCFLKDRSNLTHINLSDNSLGGYWDEDYHYTEDATNIHLILPALVPSLVSLNLAANWIGVEGAIMLASRLSGCTSLSVLNLRDNAFGEEGGRVILAAIKTLPLVELDLSVTDENDAAGQKQVAGLSQLGSELFEVVAACTQLVTLRIPSSCREFRHERQLKINCFFADLREGGGLDDRDKKGRRASLKFLAEHAILGEVSSAISLDKKLAESLTEDVSKWSIVDVMDWLTIIGLGEYDVMCEENQVDGSKLLSLDETTATSIGFVLADHRALLLENIQALRSEGLFAQVKAALEVAKKIEIAMLSSSSSSNASITRRSSVRIGRRGSIHYTSPIPPVQQQQQQQQHSGLVTATSPPPLASASSLDSASPMPSSSSVPETKKDQKEALSQPPSSSSPQLASPPSSTISGGQTPAATVVSVQDNTPQAAPSTTDPKDKDMRNASSNRRRSSSVNRETSSSSSDLANSSSDSKIFAERIKAQLISSSATREEIVGCFLELYLAQQQKIDSLSSQVHSLTTLLLNSSEGSGAVAMKNSGTAAAVEAPIAENIVSKKTSFAAVADPARVKITGVEAVRTTSFSSSSSSLKRDKKDDEAEEEEEGGGGGGDDDDIDDADEPVVRVNSSLSLSPSPFDSDSQRTMASRFHRKGSVAGKGLASPPQMEGVLTKYKGHFKRSFRRWFVLQSGGLFYYSLPHDESAQPIGCIYMTQVKDVQATQQKNGFRIETNYSKRGDYVLIAETLQQRNEWMDAIRKAAEEWKE